MIISRLLLLGCLAFCFSSCADRVLSKRAQENLDAWDRSAVYDPVTGRKYHTQAPGSAKDAIYGDFGRDVTVD